MGSRSEPVCGTLPFHVYEVSKVDRILGMVNFASTQRQARLDGWILLEQSGVCGSELFRKLVVCGTERRCEENPSAAPIGR